MDLKNSRRLLKVSRLLRVVADTILSFDEFVQDAYVSHDNLANTIKSAEDVKSLLERSGYTDLAGRMNEIVSDVRQVSEVLDKLRKMHSQGKLSYGPRTPVSVWEKRTIREKSPMETQDRPKPSTRTKHLPPRY